MGTTKQSHFTLMCLPAHLSTIFPLEMLKGKAKWLWNAGVALAIKGRKTRPARERITKFLLLFYALPSLFSCLFEGGLQIRRQTQTHTSVAHAAIIFPSRSLTPSVVFRPSSLVWQSPQHTHTSRTIIGHIENALLALQQQHLPFQ